MITAGSVLGGLWIVGALMKLLNARNLTSLTVKFGGHIDPRLCQGTYTHGP